MKKLWIVKHGFVGPMERRLKPHDNYCYETREAAEDVAKKHAARNRKLMFVLELVAAFEPPCDVIEIPIED